MRIDKTIGIIGGIFILAGIGSMLFLPGEKKWNKDADIRVGSGADISGVIMEETLQKINEKYKVSTSTESSSFQDCCSNTAQWALNAKEINVGFYCPHIAKHTIENNEDVEIYGPVLMNGETIVYITETGSKYHHSTCRTLKDSRIKTTLDSALSNGYTACGICH